MKAQYFLNNYGEKKFCHKITSLFEVFLLDSSIKILENIGLTITNIVCLKASQLMQKMPKPAPLG